MRRFEIGNHVGEVLDIESRFGHLARSRGREGIADGNQLRPVLEQGVPLEERHHELPRNRVIAIADTDRPEQHFVTRVPRHILSDPFPQQQKWRERSLILQPDEGASQLQRGAHSIEERVVVPEQRSRVQPWRLD